MPVPVNEQLVWKWAHEHYRLRLAKELVPRQHGGYDNLTTPRRYRVSLYGKGHKL